MLIKSTHYTYYTNRLSFGVPLEDVFPSGEIHPALKNLLLECYQKIAKSPYSVEEVLTSRFQGTLNERLKLKDRLIICKEFEGLKASPGALLWVARHFIGLLPVPLMPQYCDGKTYTWLEISKECRTSLSDYATRGRHNRKLLEQVTEELKRLPSPNLLLVAALLNFLRMLAVLPGGEPKINKSAIFALVKYFSSSLFLKPFRPGWITKADKQYYPLLLYLILRWPEISQICIKPSNRLFAVPLEEIYPGYCEKLLKPGYPLYLSKCRKNNATQTAASLQILPEENNALVRIIPPSYNDFSFLRDAACQTEDVGNHHKILHKKVLTQNKNHGHLIKQVNFIRKDCCCMYSTNYETDHASTDNKCNQFVVDNNESLSSNKSDFDLLHPKAYDRKLNEIVDADCPTKRYGWKFINDNLEGSCSNNSHDLNGLTHSPSSEFLETANYFYDGYSKCNLICDAENFSGSYENVKTFDPIEKEEKHSPNNTLTRKMSKMGWTYTPSSENKVTSPETVATTSSVSCKTLQQNHKLHHDDVRKSLNTELKEKLSKLKISAKYDNEIDSTCQHTDTNTTDDLAGSNSKLHLPEKLTESKKSAIKVNKRKSKLDFLRIFNTKNVKTKKSCSYEQMGSGVKYEKMGSASSLL